MKVNFKSKKVWGIAIVLLLLLIIASTNGAAASGKSDEITKLENQVEEQQKQLEEGEKERKEKDTEIEKLQAKVSEAEPWFELTEKEQQAKIKEQEEKEAKEKAEAEKKAAEEQAAKEAEEAKAKKEAEEKAKKGYETGITYDQLARTPDDYMAEKVKFKGKVIQVMEGDSVVQIRFAVNDNYDTVILGEYDASIVESRVLEDDTITIMGTSLGLYTYESTMGGEITIPSILIDKIDQ